MRSFLNKILSRGTILFPLTSWSVIAQPIQLVPHKEGSVETVAPLPSLPSQAQQTPSGFWEGTPPSVVSNFFSKIPLSLTSPTLRHLRYEVLKERYSPLLQNPSYEKSLFSLLYESGHFEEAKEFLSTTGLPEKENLLLDLQWLQGDSKKACEKITNLIRSSSNPEWKKQNIYCLYLNGEEARGKIAVELLNESSPEALPLLNALFDPSLQPPFESSLTKSPFLLSIWCAMGQDVPEEALNKIPPASLALIARSEKVPLKTRLLAAERALREGTIKGEDFLALLKDAPKEEFLPSFAQALEKPTAETLLPLFEKVAHEQKLDLVGNVFKSHLSKIEPSQTTLPLAPYIIRIHLQAGDKDLAQKWDTFFMREAPDEAISLFPLLHLAFPQNKWDESKLHLWQAYQTRTHPEKAPQNSYALRSVLEALGEASGSPLKGEPSAPSWRQEGALFNENELMLLNSAADSKRKGEVLLLVLIMVGETPLKNISPDKMNRLLKALTKAGYTNEARSLALEFLLAKGI